MGSGHSHGTATGQHRNRLIAVLAITLTIFVVEVVGGLVSGSLALLADAGHTLTDAAGVGLALLAVTFAAKPATPERTFGYQRSEILAAVVNALLLFGVAAYVLVEAARRLTDPPEVSSGLMLAVAVVGLVANTGSLLLLRGWPIRLPQCQGCLPGGARRLVGISGGDRFRRGDLGHRVHRG